MSGIPAGILGERFMDRQRGQAPVLEAAAPGNPITCLDDEAADTSETLTGKRGRAAAEGVVGSDTPI